MKFIGFDREEEALVWAKSRLGISGPTGFCRAMSATDATGKFLLVVVLSNFTPTNIDMHTAAAEGGRWATPKAIVQMFNALFHYAFTTLRARRVTGLVRAGNTAAQRFDEHLGFAREGIMREAFPDGEDLILYGFLKSDFASHKWWRKE